MPKFCPDCRAEVKEGYKFCGRCGSEIIEKKHTEESAIIEEKQTIIEKPKEREKHKDLGFALFIIGSILLIVSLVAILIIPDAPMRGSGLYTLSLVIGVVLLTIALFTYMLT